MKNGLKFILFFFQSQVSVYLRIYCFVEKEEVFVCCVSFIALYHDDVHIISFVWHENSQVENFHSGWAFLLLLLLVHLYGGQLCQHVGFSYEKHPGLILEEWCNSLFCWLNEACYHLRCENMYTFCTKVIFIKILLRKLAVLFIQEEEKFHSL